MSRPKPFIRSDIQALRGVSVLLVVLFHLRLMPGGFVGVDAFFAISGFVVATSALREVGRNGRIDIRAFYARRVRRLLPALAVMTTSISLISIALLGISLHPFAAETAIGAHLLGANIVLYLRGGGYFDPSDERNPFLHTWSLSVEEQFYLAFPVAVAIALRATRGWARPTRTRTILLLVGLAIAVSSFALAVGMSSGIFGQSVGIGLPERFAFYSPITRAWQFLAGALVAVAGLRPPSRWTNRAVPAGAVGVLVAASLLIDGSEAWPSPISIIPVAAVLVAITWGSPSSDPSRSTAWTSGILGRGLSNLGDDSYGWYLWHWPLIVLTRDVFGHETLVAWLAALVSLGIARASRTLLEDPIRFGTRLPPARILIRSTMTPVAAATLLLVGGNRAWGVDRFIDSATPSLAQSLGCVDTPDSALPTDECRAEGGSEGVVLLLGDSHAASLSDGVAEAAARLGFDSVIWARSSCPFLITGTESVRLDLGAECEDWQRRALALVDSLHPDIVVLGQRSSGYRDSITKAGGMEGDPRGPEEPWERAAATGWSHALDDTLQHLSARGVAAVVVHNVPEFPGLDDFDRSFVRRPTPPMAPRTESLRGSLDLSRIERSVAAAYTDVATLDPAEVLCDASFCHGGRGEIWWYYDRHHLSPAGSLRLVDAFIDAFERLS